MGRLSLLLGVAILAACAKKEEPAPTPPPAPPPAPAPIDLATVAGNWDFKVMPASSDSVVTTFKLAATANTTGWVMTLKDRKPMDLQVMAMGDSVMATAPQYESVLRKGVMVSTNSTFHLIGDKLVGTSVAHYNVKTADSVVTLRIEGTRIAPK